MVVTYSSNIFFRYRKWVWVKRAKIDEPIPRACKTQLWNENSSKGHRWKVQLLPDMCNRRYMGASRDLFMHWWESRAELYECSRRVTGYDGPTLCNKFLDFWIKLFIYDCDLWWRVVKVVENGKDVRVEEHIFHTYMFV